VWKAWRTEQLDVRPDLRAADLRHANLSVADLSVADLSVADLRHANLVGANLVGAHLVGAHLVGAHLSRANLVGVNVVGADLAGVNFTDAEIGATIFADNDLSLITGLDTVTHSQPSTIGIDTLYKSKGNLPEAFLRGCGVPEPQIEYLPSLLGAMEPIQFYSCFISYSHQNEEFARRLHSRMQQDHLRVWYAPEDMKAGRKLHEQIDEAIWIFDKLVLVLSAESIQSEWVMTEIRKARKAELRDKRRKLFPFAWWSGTRSATGSVSTPTQARTWRSRCASILYLILPTGKTTMRLKPGSAGCCAISRRRRALKLEPAARQAGQCYLVEAMRTDE
jgi:hypothetical protein